MITYQILKKSRPNLNGPVVKSKRPNLNDYVVKLNDRVTKLSDIIEKNKSFRFVFKSKQSCN